MTHGIVPAIAIIALLVVQGQAAFAHGVTHRIPMVTPASHRFLQSFVRIVNRSDRAGAVTIYAIDDTGGRSGPISVELNENATVNFNSTDLEQGNISKGLSGGVGPGQGNWRLELDSGLDIEVLAYMRTGSGFLTSMHDVVAEDAPGIYRVPIFNPGSNLYQQSLLRLINAGSSDAEITITGLDDRGMPPPSGEIRLILPAGESRKITAQQLESGGDNLTGSFGDGSGKWTLFVSSDHSIQVMSMLQSSDGNLTNLSRTPYVEHEPETGCYTSTQAGFAPPTQQLLDCLVVGGYIVSRYTSGVEVRYNVPAARKFVSRQTVVIEGHYAYTNTGLNTGTLTSTYTAPVIVAGDVCEHELTFESRTAGLFFGWCDSRFLIGGEGTFVIRK